MKIIDLLRRDAILLNMEATDKEAAISELVQKMEGFGVLYDASEYGQAILEREAECTTGFGDGIAIPHAKSRAVREPAIVFGRSLSGVEFEALDDKPVHLFFMIAAMEGAHAEHLATLARLSTFLLDKTFCEALLKAKSEADVLAIIEQIEQQYFEQEDDDQEPAEEEYMVLAVTGCPAGIAHTYMARDALKEEAKKQGVTIKVETNGSIGVKNRLTAEEIERAQAIIVASDMKVDLQRFVGKKLIQVPVAEGVRRPKELLNIALSSNATVYQEKEREHSELIEESKQEEKQGIRFYQHLMNGVSHMLPFVVGGGILIAISFMFGIDSDHQLAKMIHEIGASTAFALMIPILAGFIAMSIADRPGFVAGMVGGLIAFNGDTGFLGGIIAGFLGGYIALLVKRLFSRMPQSLTGIVTILVYPVLNILLTGMIMLSLVKPLSMVNLGLEQWLGNLGTANMVLLGLVLGGMMAIDMGGPINKAAFTFGIAMIEAGNFGPHAAVMAGGMVPPLGIALATTVFKSKFTKEEQEAGKTNYILGASFITEGAIPFAAADPGRVIPSAVIGSMIAGGLSAWFNIGLPTPHGGAFVIGLVSGSWYLYAISIIAGAVVTAFLLGVLKKKIH